MSKPDLKKEKKEGQRILLIMAGIALILMILLYFAFSS